MESRAEYMSKYSIKDLEHLSGIKAHTIRIWEQRYKIVQPRRTSTNIRYYDSSDLKQILNVAMLRRNGIKISKIAQMRPEEINQHIEDFGTQSEEAEKKYIHDLTSAMLDFDESHFERTLSRCILQLGLETTMYEVIQPFLIKIGYLWQIDAINPAQEHFISCLIRQKLIVAIDGQKLITNSNCKRFLLFLPEGELHEVSLLYSSYLLKKYGHQVIYLGQNLPFADLIETYKVYQPHYLISIFTTFPKNQFIQQYINDLSTNFPDVTLLLSGYLVLNGNLTFSSNTKVLHRLNDLNDILPGV